MQKTMLTKKEMMQRDEQIKKMFEFHDFCLKGIVVFSLIQFFVFLAIF